MKRIIHYGIVLFLIAITVSGTLAKINQNTSVIIAEAAKQRIKDSRNMVLKKAKEFKVEEAIAKGPYEFIPGYNNGEKVGYVTNVISPGYGGDIKFVLGVDLSGEITGINIIESKETPGLGAKIMESSWQKKWKGRTSDYDFDKSVDAFAGATVSPKAVYTGIQDALKVYEEKVKKRKNKEEKININNLRKKVLPFATEFRTDQKINKENFKFIPGYNKDKKVGYITTVEAKGYKGKIEFILGFNLGGEVSGIEIIKNTESSGVGDKLNNSTWLEKWKEKTSNYEFNYETDAIAGATKSQTAVHKKIREVLKIYEEGVKSNE